MQNTSIKYPELIQKLTTVFETKGLDFEKAESLARILTEGELLGHTTHGLALVKPYLDELESGQMETDGSFEILNSTNTTETWDGRYLPGTWLTEKAIEKASEIAKKEGIGTVVIQKSHHIACLAAFLEVVARQNLMVIIACSDPRNATVAPFGGKVPVYSPNPLALGIPTESEPILIDVSMSTTANAVVNRAAKNNEKLGGDWLLKPDGTATNDPQTFFEKPASTVLPLGGMDLGYKGFALGIIVEAMTSALGGHGRSDNPERWGASVFVQVIDPSKFSGENYFLKEMQFFKNACLASTPLNEKNPVRMPGEKGLERKKWNLENGMALNEEFKNLISF
ncbi:Ldh family oxidoreductase [Lacihabitans sp. LS3-19]|uniref:Ldh family oxidoreductase n=1 Tax=Lacihabitans sp. LS3-19 TaxID=2487335 RepID=UPI0020CC9C71|nr:Ldh family oxidoreductase [Lacihabitans sp. LS3-19]MCP9770218.1 Ldh family oxidoreductase [Lacihabitans sp. LS3-19]